MGLRSYSVFLNSLSFFFSWLKMPSNCLSPCFGYIFISPSKPTICLSFRGWVFLWLPWTVIPSSCRFGALLLKHHCLAESNTTVQMKCPICTLISVSTISTIHTKFLKISTIPSFQQYSFPQVGCLCYALPPTIFRNA